MINKKNWVPWTINICLVVFVIALLYNESSFKDKREIEKVYKAYIEDFIENDFEGIASHFEAPTNFKNFGIIAEDKLQIILALGVVGILLVHTAWSQPFETANLSRLEMLLLLPM